MGQASSKATKSFPRHKALRKAAAEAVANAKAADKTSVRPALTREQMLDEDSNAEDASGKDARLAENLKYFLNPKELVTPITPKNPMENINVQTLRSRRADDDVEVVGVAGRLSVKELAEVVGDINERGRSAGDVAKKWGLEVRDAEAIAMFLENVKGSGEGRRKGQKEGSSKGVNK